MTIIAAFHTTLTIVLPDTLIRFIESRAEQSLSVIYWLLLSYTLFGLTRSTFKNKYCPVTA